MGNWLRTLLDSICPEVGTYKRKRESKKTRKQELDQEKKESFSFFSWSRVCFISFFFCFLRREYVFFLFFFIAFLPKACFLVLFSKFPPQNASAISRMRKKIKNVNITNFVSVTS